jgi:hypothetical protein
MKKIPKYEIFDILFFTLINPIGVGEKNYFWKTEAVISYFFVLFMPAQCAQINFLRSLSVR